MTIHYENDMATVHCDNCGCDSELISLYRIGSGLHCPVCIDGDISHGHVGYISDVLSTGLQEEHFVKIGG